MIDKLCSLRQQTYFLDDNDELNLKLNEKIRKEVIRKAVQHHLDNGDRVTAIKLARMVAQAFGYNGYGLYEAKTLINEILGDMKRSEKTLGVK